MCVALALELCACVGTLHRRHGIAPIDLSRPTFASIDVPAGDHGPAYTLRVGVTEVTQRHFREVMSATPSYIDGCDDCPVETVSWYDAAAYTNALSSREGLEPCYRLESCTTTAPYARRTSLGDRLHHPAGLVCDVVERVPSCAGYRLPTIAEWNVYGRVHAVEGGERLANYAVFGVVDAVIAAHPVATRLPNELGLFDTLGNVEEWLEDRAPIPVNASEDRRASTGATWFHVAGTSFTMRRRDVTYDHMHAEVGSWGRDCAGFRVVQTVRAATVE